MKSVVDRELLGQHRQARRILARDEQLDDGVLELLRRAVVGEHREQLAGHLAARAASRALRPRAPSPDRTARRDRARSTTSARDASRPARPAPAAPSRRRRTSRRGPAPVDAERSCAPHARRSADRARRARRSVDTRDDRAAGVLARDQLDARMAVRPAQLALGVEPEHVAEVVDRVAVAASFIGPRVGSRRVQHARAIGGGVARAAPGRRCRGRSVVRSSCARDFDLRRSVASARLPLALASSSRNTPCFEP